MIRTAYDETQNRVLLTYGGKIDLRQAEALYRDFQALLPKCPRGFKLLVDLSSVEFFSRDALSCVKKLMELCNRHGVSEIVRIIPDPEKDFGFSILSVFHYDKTVKVVTCQSIDQVPW